MEWKIVKVRPEEHLLLSVCFKDGTKGQVRFEPSHLRGVFKVLENPSFFNQVFIDRGVVTWPGELDLASDAMYDAIRHHGQWILR